METLHENGTNITYETLLKKMQTLLAKNKFTQVPQLSSTEHFAPATQPLQLIQVSERENVYVCVRVCSLTPPRAKAGLGL